VKIYVNASTSSAQVCGLTKAFEYPISNNKYPMMKFFAVYLPLHYI
jgi:hypothetical protein